MGTRRRDNIFVVGCQRSGTSVVWASLTAHSELKPIRGYDAATGYDPKELYYFRNIFKARRDFDSPMYGWDVDSEYMKRVIDVTIDHCIEHHGSLSGRFVNAHPADGLYIEEILEAMPEARIVCVLRHPEEVVWSTVHAPWADPKRTRDPVTLRRAAHHWREHAVAAKRVIDGDFGDSVLLVRHEKLLTSPSETAEQLADHVGVALEPVMAETLGGPTFNSSFKNDTSPARLAIETRRAISRASFFRRLVCYAVGAEMEELGYTDLGNPPLVIRQGWRSVFSTNG